MDDNRSVGEVTDLLQHLIRNECVNDGSAASGHEWRNADLLANYLDIPGIEIESYEPSRGRKSIVARLNGADPHAPTLMLLGHTDVVPASPDGWDEDPFGGTLANGRIYGRGALDMLGQLAAMASAFRTIARGRQLAGTLLLVAVADEESMGQHGARWLWENEPEAVRADMVLGESGGFPMSIPGAGGARLPIMVTERGVGWYRLRVSGKAGHASLPLGSRNAVIVAAQIIRRLVDRQAPPQIHNTWRSFLRLAELPADLKERLADPARLTAASLSDQFPQLAPGFYAATHDTLAPTVVRGGSKTNVIPDSAEVELDMRFLPGHTPADLASELRESLEGFDGVAVNIMQTEPATQSPINTPLWRAIGDVTSLLAPGKRVVPFVHPGITDLRFARSHGAVAYGAGLFSEDVPYHEFYSLLHGANERIDQVSLALLTEFYRRIPERVNAHGSLVGSARTISSGGVST